MQYDNTNRGALFPNKEKSTEKHPDVQGSINVDGVDYYISGWKQEAKNGGKYISLSVKPKEVKEKEVEVDDEPFDL